MNDSRSRLEKCNETHSFFIALTTARENGAELAFDELIVALLTDAENIHNCQGGCLPHLSSAESAPLSQLAPLPPAAVPRARTDARTSPAPKRLKPPIRSPHYLIRSEPCARHCAVAAN